MSVRCQQFTEGLDCSEVMENLISPRGGARGRLHQQHWRYTHRHALCTPALWKDGFLVSTNLEHACPLIQQVIGTSWNSSQQPHARPIAALHSDLCTEPMSQHGHLKLASWGVTLAPSESLLEMPHP